MQKSSSRKLFLTMLIIIALAVMPFLGAPALKADGPQSPADNPIPSRPHDLRAIKGTGVFLSVMVDGQRICREATPQEAEEINRRDPNQRLQVLNPIRTNESAGLKIMLRGTQQLNSFPEARDAFLRAAATWESLIASEITLVIDVDFGPTRFGTPYPRGVLGSTGSQVVGADNLYADLRSAFVEDGTGDREKALYALLPSGARVPTDIGDTAFIFAPTATFRAIGFLEPVANPSSEMNQLGPPPSIGFNSAFNYDFDPSNGISPGMIDFDGVAVHEIGHALGFVSQTGARELRPTSTLALTIWDLFRLRPTAAIEQFGSAQRILSSGGDQAFFNMTDKVQLSTGRPDGSGGDGAQASHWKDDSIIGRKIGIMDPNLSPGERDQITMDDIIAIDLFGYRVAAPMMMDTTAPTVNVTAPAAGITLTGGQQFNITWTSQDNVGVARHNIDLSIDGGQTFPTNIATGLAGDAQSFIWTVPDINAAQARIRVTAIDAANNMGNNNGAGNFNIMMRRPDQVDFNLSVTPASQTVQAGMATSFTINAQAVGNFTQAVNLAAALAPTSANVTTSLSAATVNPGGMVTLTVNTTPDTPASTFSITLTGTAGQIVKTATVTLNVTPQPDYSIGFNPATITVARKQKGNFTVNINRVGGFAGNVTVTAPDTKAAKIKLTSPTSQSTTGNSVMFGFKVKNTAARGSQTLVFTARDDSGRVRTATLTVVIQ